MKLMIVWANTFILLYMSTTLAKTHYLSSKGEKNYQCLKLCGLVRILYSCANVFCFMTMMMIVVVVVVVTICCVKIKNV